MITDLGIVVVAAGSSQRFGKRDKLTFDLDQAPLFTHCLKTFTRLIPLNNIVVVVSPEKVTEFQKIIQQVLALELTVVSGGAQRRDSSLKGLQALPHSLEYAGVHDAARPFISTSSLELCYKVLKSRGSAVLARPVTDTMKVATTDGKVLRTVPRQTIYAAETPQMFNREKLIAAYLKAPLDANLTDEAMAMEAAAHEVYLAVHKENNKKITYSNDLLKKA